MNSQHFFKKKSQMTKTSCSDIQRQSNRPKMWKKCCDAEHETKM